MTTPEKTEVKKLITQKKMPAITAATGAQADASKAKSKKSMKASNSVSSLSTEERRKMIADNAYYRAQRRNFSTEGIESDWLDAESEVNSWLK
jgi:hypothetical protein